MNKLTISLIILIITSLVVLLLDYLIFSAEQYRILGALASGSVAFLASYFVIKRKSSK